MALTIVSLLAHSSPSQYLTIAGNKLMDQIFDLKFTSKQLVRQAKKCEKEEKTEKLKVCCWQALTAIQLLSLLSSGLQLRNHGMRCTGLVLCRSELNSALHGGLCADALYAMVECLASLPLVAIIIPSLFSLVFADKEGHREGEHGGRQDLCAERHQEEE